MTNFASSVGRLGLPLSIITAAMLWPRPEPAVITVEIPELPAPIVTVEAAEFPEFPQWPEYKPPIVNVQPAEPVVVEKRVDVPGPTRTVYEEVEVEVERIVEVRTCLNFDELPSWDLPRALTAARPGEAWSLSGDYYSGLVWSDSTPKPTQTEIIAGWLKSLEAECD